jgi:tetratricopeptide (TPR) repeat protein
VTAEELIQKTRDQRSRGRLEEALVSVERAVQADPHSATAWWELALTRAQAEDLAAAIPSLRKTIELAPHFAPAWDWLGDALIEDGDRDEALECYERALKEDPKRVETLITLHKLYKESGNEDKERPILQALDELTELDLFDVHRLGNQLYASKDYDAAVQRYKRCTGLPQLATSAYFNMGLAYSKSTVSQDADAVDALRRVLELDPEHQRALDLLKHLLPRLTLLRERVLTSGARLLDSSDCYARYLSPIELLDLGDCVSEAELDLKALQKAKKRVLHEIDLEEGRIPWIDGLQIDRSRAISLCEELSDPRLRGYHTTVFQNTELLEFLSRGQLAHFLVHPSRSPMETLGRLEADPQGFAAWLSPIFAAQFDAVFVEALRRKHVSLIEALLDGRRWVLPGDADRCFEGADREVPSLLEPLRKAARQVESEAPTVAGVSAILNEGRCAEILGLLPTHFHETQTEATGLVRSIAIAAYNNHGDAELAKAILKLSQSFSFKSPILTHQIEEDSEALENLIREERKDECRLTLNKQRLEITKEGARLGEEFIATKDVTSVRWGMVVDRSSGRGVITQHMVIGGGGRVLNIQWRAGENEEDQQKFFKQLVDAVIVYLMPGVMLRLEAAIDAGATIRFGPVRVTKNGVQIAHSGWFSTKLVDIPWPRLDSDVANGGLVLKDMSSPKVSARLPLHETDNAFPLFFLAARRKKD